MASTLQQIQVGERGTLPDICEPTIEDTKLLGGNFALKKYSAPRRKQMMSNPEVRHSVRFSLWSHKRTNALCICLLLFAKNYVFDPKYEYKFTLYSHAVFFHTYKANLAITSLHLASYLNNQPLQIMAKDDSGRYLFNYDVWHESLLSPDERG